MGGGLIVAPSNNNNKEGEGEGVGEETVESDEREGETHKDQRCTPEERYRTTETGVYNIECVVYT